MTEEAGTPQKRGRSFHGVERKPHHPTRDPRDRSPQVQGKEEEESLQHHFLAAETDPPENRPVE